MISIIICSVNKDYLRDIRENISRTIGMACELLVWDNRYEKKGLCEVYNLMAEKAKFPYLCFMHEDIFFETQDWGQLLAGLFRDHPETGVIGIAGTRYKSAMFSGWFTGNRNYDLFNFTHRVDGVDHKERQVLNGMPRLVPVVCIDGVLMACRSQIWEDIRFDSDKLKGFHYYDIDFSLRAARKYGVGVTAEIDLVHITQGGDYGDRWVETTIQYHADQANGLPFWLKGTGVELPGQKTEVAIAAIWLDRLKNEKISWRNKRQWVQRQRLLRFLPALWYPILRFFVFRPLKLNKVQQWMNRNRS